MPKIEVWFDAEQVKEGNEPKIYLSVETIRGNMVLTENGYKLSLFLTTAQADNLAFAINCNLQEIELLKKERK